MADPGALIARPTLEDVAREAGVSRATVSRVVNGKPDVAPRIQEIVHAAIAMTGYVPNRAARSLVTRRAGAVVVVVSGSGSPESGGATSVDFSDPFFGRVVGGLVRALRPRDVDPVLMLVETAADRNRVLAYLRHGDADGALLVSTHSHDPLPALLVEAGLPVVMFARPSGDVSVNFVDVANRDGARLAADRLVARGCTRIVTISGPLDVPAAYDRWAGFRDALARHGHASVPAAEGSFSFAGGAAAMRDLLAREPELDAVFAANDLMALGAIDALEAAGRRVPQDVAVVGFDDSALAALSRPGLTSVRQPIEDMGAKMVSILLAQIAEPGRRHTSVIFEPTLRVRASA